MLSVSVLLCICYHCNLPAEGGRVGGPVAHPGGVQQERVRLPRPRLPQGARPASHRLCQRHLSRLLQRRHFPRGAGPGLPLRAQQPHHHPGGHLEEKLLTGTAGELTIFCFCIQKLLLLHTKNDHGWRLSFGLSRRSEAVFLCLLERERDEKVNCN